MNNYTIYCSREQTKKAIGLGAPIDHSSVCYEGFDIVDHNEDYSPKLYAITPTAEQMISWLEQDTLFKCIQVSIDAKPTNWMYAIYYGKDGCIALDRFSSREKATLAAIDAALEYLEKKGGEA